jgi:hypothetical protein
MDLVIRRSGSKFSRSAVLIAVVAVGIGVSATTAQSQAAQAKMAVSGAHPAYQVPGNLNGVADLSPANAWAVGLRFNRVETAFALIVHWNGVRWQRSALPRIPPGSALEGIAALSARNIWAVGVAAGKPIILHWNGRAWRRIPDPANGPGPKLQEFTSVAAASAHDIWAIGNDDDRTGSGIAHWNGKTWRLVPTPKSSSSSLQAVAARSAHRAWAVGAYNPSADALKTLVLKWSGSSWKKVPSPSPAGVFGILTAVDASSARDAWAVGCAICADSETFATQWTGKKWR